jgi:hypothetical protein
VGVAIAFIAFLVLLESLGRFDYEVWDLWPVALILVGLGIVWGGYARSRTGAAAMVGGTELTTAAGAPPESFAKVTTILSSTYRVIRTQDFRGGDVTTVLASSEIDLRQSSLAGRVALDITAILGGVELRVPPDWNVVIDGTFIGGVDDRTVRAENTSKTLVVRGFAVLAGIEITN